MINIMRMEPAGYVAGSAECIVFLLLSYVHSGCGQRVVNQCLGLSPLHS